MGQPVKHSNHTGFCPQVTPGSPAAKIGLKSNDVVTEVGDVPTETMTGQEVLDLIGQYGDSIVITVERWVT